MLAVIACLAGIAAILVAAEILWRQKILRGEYQRKFVHIGVGTFVAFWPWLISFKAIQLLGLLMLVTIIFVQQRKLFHFTREPVRISYGFVFFALAILTVSLLTNNKVIFAIAILNMALADGLAAVAGHMYGRRWKYLILTHTKTVVGSMTFWFVSLCILGTGLLFSANLMPNYLPLLIFLPPALMIIENIPGLGSDNVFVPLATVVVLKLIS